MTVLAGFKRRVVQVLAMLLYNLNLPGFVQGSIWQGASKAVCVPGLNCYSCPGALASCPIGSLQAALIASDQKLPLYIVGTLLAFGALFGRTVCGWLCPFGLIQELLHKVPLPKLGKGAWSRALSYGKYIVLFVCVVAIPLLLARLGEVGSPFFCAWLCPAGTLEAGIPLTLADPALRSLVGAQFWWKLGLLIAVFAACLCIYRPFCRFLCPLGALYSFFNRFALLRYRVDASVCTACGTCTAACKADVRKVSDRECIQCGECAKHCEHGAISFTLTGPKGIRRHTMPELKLTRTGAEASTRACARLSAQRAQETQLKPSASVDSPARTLRKPRAVLAGAAAMLLLILSLSAACTAGPSSEDGAAAGQGSSPAAGSNAEDNATDAGTAAPGERVKEGDIAPDFFYATLDGTTSSLAELKGEVVLLNFWASWCPPCVAEMPDIERLRVAYPELQVLAVSLDTGEAEMRAFVEERGYDFAWIHDVGYRIANLYPESAIPYTIIINRDGVITATFLGSPPDPFATYESAIQAAGI